MPRNLEGHNVMDVELSHIIVQRNEIYIKAHQQRNCSVPVYWNAHDSSCTFVETPYINPSKLW